MYSTGNILHSVTFILVAIFLWLMREKDLRKSHKSLSVVVLNVMMCSLDVNVNVSVVRTTALDKGQERRQLWVRVKGSWRLLQISVQYPHKV